MLTSTTLMHRDDKHRGDLTVASAADGGAVFTLRLPRWAHRSGEEEQ